MKIYCFSLRLGVAAVLLWLAPSAWAQKVSALPNTNSLSSNSLFSVSSGGTVTKSISFGTLSNILESATISHLPAFLNTNESRISGSMNLNRMRVPPRVWGTWNDFPEFASASWVNSTNVNEVYIRTLCDWWATNGMRDAGWKYIVLEENWQTGLDASGKFIVNTAADKFPSGLTNLCAYIKSKGFIPGIYTSVSANAGGLTCEGFAGTCYTNLDKHFQQFADWGVEFVFCDACSGYYPWTDVPNQVLNTEEELYAQRNKLINSAILKTGKQMAWLQTTPAYSPTGLYNPDSYSQLNITFTHPDAARWDFIPASQTVETIAHRTQTNSLNGWLKNTSPGHYFYQGLMSRQLSESQYKITFCLQAMAAGAMFIDSGTYHINSVGNSNVASYLGPYANPPSTWDDPTYSRGTYKTNLEIAAIHQDPAVVPGHLVWSNSLAEIWSRPLGQLELPDEYAVLVLNLSPTNKTITVPFNLFAPNNSYFALRDAVALTNFPSIYTNTVDVTVAPTNCMLLRLSPPTPTQQYYTLPNFVLTNNWSGSNFTTSSNVVVNAGGNEVLIGAVDGYADLYSGIWFQPHTYGGVLDFGHMAVGGTSGNNWLNGLSKVELRVNNLFYTRFENQMSKFEYPIQMRSWLPPAAMITTYGSIVNSNSLLYWMTSTSTNLVTGNIPNKFDPQTPAFPEGFQIRSNTVSVWPATPPTAGACYFGNSNGTIYLLTSGLGLTWLGTNKLAP